MFEHFTFGAASQLAPREEIPSPSPTDTSFAPSSPPPSSHTFYGANEKGINSIIEQFGAHSLSRDSLVRQFRNWGTDEPSPLEVDDEEDDTLPDFPEDTYFAPSLKHTTSLPTSPIREPAEGGITYRRFQRQLNVHMQTSSSHIRDINALVENMISSSSQCRLHNAPSRSYPSPPPSRDSSNELEVDVDTSAFDEVREDDIDEGFHEDPSLEEELGLTLRRVNTPSGIRKFNNYSGFTWTRSRDVVCVNGRMKVRCKPRMRKRKKMPVPASPVSE